MIGLLKPAAAVERLPAERIDPTYKRLRRQVFAGIFVGFFGYVFGTAVSGAGVGWIADRWGWRGVFGTMVVCCVLTMVFSALTLGHKAHSASRQGQEG